MCYVLCDLIKFNLQLFKTFRSRIYNFTLLIKVSVLALFLQRTFGATALDYSLRRLREIKILVHHHTDMCPFPGSVYSGVIPRLADGLDSWVWLWRGNQSQT